MVAPDKVGYYQREITSPERLFSRSPFSIVTMVARIKGHVSVEMLREVVAKVQRRHALLRVRIIEDSDHSQQFTSDGVQDIPIDVVPRESEDDWIKIHSESSRIPYEFDIRPAIRFILVQSQDVSDLIILCHHIICDGMSLAYLARDLMVYLGDPSQEVDELPGPIPIMQDNLPGDISQSGVVKFFINRINRQWANDSEFFDNEDYRILTKAYWDNFNHGILSIELSEEETSALVARCREEQVTVNSALTAAISGAQSSVQGKKSNLEKTVIGTDLRDRLPQSPAEAVGYYAAGVELKLKYNHKKDFWDNAAAFHQQIKPNFTNKKVFSEIINWLYLDPTFFEAMNFKKLGGLVPQDSPRYGKLSTFSKKEDAVLRFLKRDNMDSLDTVRLGAGITNLGRLDFPHTYGSLELDRLIMQPGGAFPLSQVNLVLGAVTCSGKLSMVIEYAEQSVDPVTMVKVKDRAMEYLLGGY